MQDETSGNGLGRTVGLFPLTNIVIANMIGAGIFTTSGLLIEGLGDPVVMLGLWVAGGVMALCGALCYGELGAALPRAGGEYAFLSKLYHPLAGFLSGWVSLFAGFSAPIAASAIGCAEYLTRAFPSLVPGGGDPSSVEAAVVKKACAIAVVISFTSIHARGIELGTRVQNVLTILKVALIVGLITVGLSSGGGDVGHFSPGGATRLDFAGWKTIGLSLMWIMFAYSGWNASAYIGSEVKDPSKNIPRSLIAGTGFVIILYLLLNVFYVYAVPPGEMSGVISVAGLAVGNVFGRSFETVLSVMISFALFSSLSAFIILGPRIYYAMSRDGIFFRMAAETHPRFRAPTKAIVLQGCLASIMVLFGAFDQILTYMGFSLGIFPILAVVGVFKLRRSGRESGYRLPGYPVVPLVYLAMAGFVLVLAFFERPFESSIAIVTVLTGIPAYFLFLKRSRTRNG